MQQRMWCHRAHGADGPGLTLPSLQTRRPGLGGPFFCRLGLVWGLQAHTLPVPRSLDTALGRVGETHGTRISCTLLMTCLPTMMTSSS